ncbi:MAG: polysaccharide biosynthesis tyrosine autokinase [Bacteroidales bacterium]
MQNFDGSFGEETLDLKKYIKKYIHLWPWFIASLLLALVAAACHNLYKENTYQNSLTLLIKEEGSLLTLEDQIASNLFTVSNIHLQNQIGVLTSRTLARKTLKSLNFAVEYHKDKTFGKRELYPNSFFKIEFDSLHPQVVNTPIKLSRNKDGTWNVTTSFDEANLHNFSSEKNLGKIYGASIDEYIKAGKWIETDSFRFKIHENKHNLPKTDDSFTVIFRDIESQTRKNQKLRVEEIRNSTMLKLVIEGNNRKKNEVFLNMHAQKFLQRDLNKKNIRAQKTVDFIEEQLSHVSELLKHSERSLEDFRSEEQILNIDFQSQRTFEQMEKLQQEKAQHIVEEKYYDYLANYLEQVEDDGSELIAPSSLGVEDPLLSGLINQLMQLYAERSEILINSKKDNPLLSNVESRIKHTKKTIKESLKSIQQANSLAISNLDERIEKVSQTISLIPQSQKQLFNIERQFKLHDALYTLLQTKKSEIEISKAGLTPVHEIIDTALASDSIIISPKKKMTYIMAVFIGLLLPLLPIILLDFFNDKVRSDEDVEKIGLFPILGYIANNPAKDNQLISFKKHSIQAESFRSVRTNAQFVMPPNEKPVVMVTSTLFEEGKTFVSFNLAASYASMKKRTILLSLDMRKPKLTKYLRKSQSVGLSNFLSSNIPAKDIIKESHVENLDIAFSGPIPPNPAELLNSPKVKELFDYLKEHYDYIIIDTPPAGMVADALILINHVNVVMYLVRHNRTPIKHLQHTLKSLKEKGIRNVNLVLNDAPLKKRSYHYNSYGYNYGYFEKS